MFSISFLCLFKCIQNKGILIENKALKLILENKSNESIKQ
jgi:hypothetical protein